MAQGLFIGLTECELLDIKAKAVSLYRMKFSKDALKTLDRAGASDPATLA